MTPLSPRVKKWIAEAEAAVRRSIEGGHPIGLCRLMGSQNIIGPISSASCRPGPSSAAESPSRRKFWPVFPWPITPRCCPGIAHSAEWGAIPRRSSRTIPESPAARIYPMAHASANRNSLAVSSDQSRTQWIPSIAGLP